jgi:hypothetical protein
MIMRWSPPGRTDLATRSHGSRHQVARISPSSRMTGRTSTALQGAFSALSAGRAGRAGRRSMDDAIGRWEPDAGPRGAGCSLGPLASHDPRYRPDRARQGARSPMGLLGDNTLDRVVTPWSEWISTIQWMGKNEPPRVSLGGSSVISRSAPRPGRQLHASTP